ncbi:cytochrome P450 [Marasmius fiardii PR-910]|nr:cytochrome P450 [Marasmius fiardii PR-910]
MPYPAIKFVEAPPSSKTIVFAALLATTFACFRFSYNYISGRKTVDDNRNSIPPGPVGFPIVGSFPFLLRHPELTLDSWAKMFGPLYSLKLGNQLVIVISDPQIVKDLFITNGAIFSSRKEMYLKTKIITAGRGVTAMPYGDRWRQHRRIASTSLTIRAVDGYAHTLDYEATTLVMDLLKHGNFGATPVNSQPYTGRFSLNNMLVVAFGMRTDTIDHPLVAEALRLSREFMNCTGPVSNLTDFIPLLQKIPGNYMINRAKQLHKDLVDTYGGMLLDIESRLNSKEKVPDCFAKHLIEIKEEERLDHVDMAMLCVVFTVGGVETTASVIQWFLALIPTHPEIQQKAQKELDRVVGHDRLPTTEDEKDLPYIHAIIKEVERLGNPFWLGNPHSNTSDFTYRGQFIPKNTVLIVNTYTMHHDPLRYPEPSKFNPERYINDSTLSSVSANLANPWERDHWMFGVGRRICPGMRVAEREIFLVIARLLWAFDMKETPGEPINLKEYDGLSGRSPVPFRIKMIPRHAKVMEVLDRQRGDT